MTLDNQCFYAKTNRKGHTMETTYDPLIPLHLFKKSGRCPVEPYHHIFRNKQSLVDYGAIVPNGSRWLVDEAKFHDWFRVNANQKS